MIISQGRNVLCAIVIFILTYHVVPDSLSELNILNQFALNYSILYHQLITGLILSVSIYVLFTKIDFGLRLVDFNWKKIILIAICIEAIPFAIFLLLFFFDDLYLSSWMLLSLGEIVCYHLILSPLIEEVFFRGVVQTLLSPLSRFNLKYRSILISSPVILTSILFTSIHSYSSIAVIFIFSLSIFCGLLQEKYQSVFPGALAHLVFNSLAVFIPKLILIIGKTF